MAKIRRALLCLGGLLALAVPHAAMAEALPPFDAWLAEVRRQAVAEGISESTVSAALAGIAPDETVIRLDAKQPEKTITFETYSRRILSSPLVAQGRRRMQAHGAALRRAEQLYGVPPHIVVALWGIESAYGANSGSFSVIESLATLAYEGRRSAFFRDELMAALRILAGGQRAPDALEGSWAGAMGQCQFMPSTYLKFAVDGDGDGVIDIWDNEDDVIASIAHYLAAEGWKPGERWGREVRIPRTLSPHILNADFSASVAEWSSMGVRSVDGAALPRADMSASLAQPDGPGGRAFLIYDNVRALKRWNRSTYFALTVGLLADRL